MSASERLKALGPVALDALDELSGDAGWAHAYQPGPDSIDREPDVRAVLDALPQIVAVIEAAERECDYGGCHACGMKPGFGHADDCALTALEEALGGDVT